MLGSEKRHSSRFMAKNSSGMVSMRCYRYTWSLTLQRMYSGSSTALYDDVEHCLLWHPLRQARSFAEEEAEGISGLLSDNQQVLHQSVTNFMMP